MTGIAEMGHEMEKFTFVFKEALTAEHQAVIVRDLIER